MDNIHLNSSKSHSHKLSGISLTHYQAASNSLLVLHAPYITKYTYTSKYHQLEHSKTYGPIEQLNQTVLMIEDMVEQEVILVVTCEGSIFTIDESGEADIKAQNEDGITAATVSPLQEYVYLVTKNKSLIQLNNQYDLVNQIAVDEGEEVLDSAAQFSWRADGDFFVLNYETANGHKALTKDLMMVTFVSASKSDPIEDGLVQSVSEKGRVKMSHLVAWQPSGSMVAGGDFVTQKEEKIVRVIFWEKNGLRHREFELPKTVVEIVQLFWSADSSILYVKVKQQNNSLELLLYFRSNYHWYLKHVVYLTPSDNCLPLTSQNHKNQLLIVQDSTFEILQLETRLPLKEWKQEQTELKFKYEFNYFIDGPVANITDLGKYLMPPPMSMFQHHFGKDIVAVSKLRHNLLVATREEVFLFDFIKQAVVEQCSLGLLLGKKLPDFTLLQTDAIIFSSNSHRYACSEGQLQCSGEYPKPHQKYVCYTSEKQQTILTISHLNDELTINDISISHECSSFIFYHQFLIFTVSTSQMYDKLYVINLSLSQWVYQEDAKIKSRLAEMETKDLLNHRLVERGSKIVSVCNGRVVFQLPRGNFEAISPKIITINQVRKYIQNKQYLLAFETIRTHKLDFNLLHDIDPLQFETQIQLVLKDIQRVDYINLVVSHTTEVVSSELQYIMTLKDYENVISSFELNLKGKKVKKVCKLVAEMLRTINQEEYILSIFTSEIKAGKLNSVLFEIKEMKKNQVEVIVPPHIPRNNEKRVKKVLTAQGILEYVCWLVDPNAIYEAALLTYDLELAALTARCTQKDPKEYIPYLEALKSIQNVVQFHTTICLDLKKYEIAVKQLSYGSAQQKSRSLDLIKQHKLYKHGLMVYNGKPQLKDVKGFIIEQLLATGQINEAYRVSQSIGLHQKALEIATNSMDSKKIKECIEILFPTKEERQKQVNDIIETFKDQIKNRFQLAKLFAYIENYEQAILIYLKHNEYRKAYKYLWKVSEQFIQKEMKEGYQLCFSIRRNEIIKDRKDFMEKYTRLRKLHKEKEENGITSTFKERENDDMYSEVSMSSKAQSSYTMSTTTGMRKKKDKKKSILGRNVKEGSPLEEEYLLAYIKMLEDKVEEAVKDAKLLVQHLIYMNLIEQAETLRNQVREYLEPFKTYPPKSFAKAKFQESHPEAYELYFQPKKLSTLTIDSFNYLF